MKIEVFNKDSQVVGDIDFNVSEDNSSNGILLNRFVRTMLMNKRQGNASTKSRGEVSGGGKKPWKQKGTGRARAGSVRSPLFVGGGVIFGPKPKDYSLKMNKKEKRAAFLQAVTQRAANGGFVVIDDFNFESPKTKEAYEILQKFNIKKALVVLDNDMKNAYLSLRNIKGIEVKNINSLNVYDVLRFEKIIAPKSVIEKINRRITNE